MVLSLHLLDPAGPGCIAAGASACALAVLLGACGGGQPSWTTTPAPAEAGWGAKGPRHGAEERVRPTATALDLPRGRAIGALEEEACFELLAEASVAFESVHEEALEQGLRVGDDQLGPLTVETRSRSRVHHVLDCRLAVALLAWSPVLAEEGLTHLIHYSSYRPGARVGGSGRRSGHARALAIDIGVFIDSSSGERFEVEETWLDRERGVDPCSERDEDPSGGQARLRRVVCAAVESEIFQVVLTPHHDRAHRNHIHLEVRPGVDWMHVR